MTWSTWKTSCRFIVKNKMFTTINLLGLTAGLTVSFFLFVYIINEFSYNSSFRDSDRIYRILTETKEHTMTFSPSRVAPFIQRYTPGILKTGKLVFLPFLTGPVPVKQTDGFINETNVVCVDQGMFEILPISMVSGKGSPNLLVDRIMLSASAAQQCFGDTPPVGKQIDLMVAGIPVTLTVSGVFEDFPWNSTLHVDYMMGMDFFFRIIDSLSIDIKTEMETCTDFYAESYLLTDKSFRLGNVEKSLGALRNSLQLNELNITFRLQPIREIYHGEANITNDIHKKGNRKSLLYYGSLALFTLLLASINYTILSTARASTRYKEIGVRKILGADTRRLRVQLLLESMVLTFLAFPLTFFILGILEPFLDYLLGYNVQFFTHNILIYIPLFAGITLLIGLISGLLASGYLIALHPLKAIQNKLLIKKRSFATPLFIVIQLFITLSLLICSIIIFKQLYFCLHKEVSIDSENLVIVPFNPGEFANYPGLRDAIREKTFIISASGSSNAPPSVSNAITSVNIPNLVNRQDTLKTTIDLETYSVDADFFYTIGIPVITGTDFHNGATDSGNSAIIFNQEAINALNVDFLSKSTFSGHPILGIAANFHTHSLYSPIRPALFINEPEACNSLIVRHLPGYQTATINALKLAWDSLAPDLHFSYHTYPEAVSQLYRKETTFGQIVLSFALLAFIITGMGLFGLAILITQRSMKSIAIRKVFGAPNADILFRMQKDFLIFLGTASFFAVPSSWFLMRYWLSAFYYKTSMEWYIFVLAVGVVGLFISLIMFFRTYNMLRKRPVRSLKHE